MSKLSNKAFAIMAVCEKTKEHFGLLTLVMGVMLLLGLLK